MASDSTGTGVGAEAGAAPDNAAGDAGNPLVGLKRNDGLGFGTTQLQPRVKLLQHRLNEKTGSTLVVDGMWGAKTSKALESFMLSRSTVPAELVGKSTGDALMDDGGGGKGGGKGGGNGGGDPPPGAAPFNPHVESMLEAVLEEYRRPRHTPGS